MLTAPKKPKKTSWTLEELEADGGVVWGSEKWKRQEAKRSEHSDHGTPRRISISVLERIRRGEEGPWKMIPAADIEFRMLQLVGKELTRIGLGRASNTSAVRTLVMESWSCLNLDRPRLIGVPRQQAYFSTRHFYKRVSPCIERTVIASLGHCKNSGYACVQESKWAARAFVPAMFNASYQKVKQDSDLQDKWTSEKDWASQLMQHHINEDIGFGRFGSTFQPGLDYQKNYSKPESFDAIFLTFHYMRSAWSSGKANYGEAPEPMFFVGAGIAGLMALAAAAVLIMGLLTKYWLDRNYHLSLVVLVLLGASLQISACSIRALGYQVLGHVSTSLSVPEFALDILERLALVTFLAIFAVFTFVVAEAVLDTVFPDRKDFVSATGWSLVIVTTLAVVYGIAMASYSAFPTSVYVFDASVLVIEFIGFVFSLGLAIIMLYVWRLVVNEPDEVHSAEKRRNALIFSLVLVFLTLLFSARLVLAFLWMFKSAATFSLPLGIVNGIAGFTVASVILLYLGIPIVVRLKQKRQAAASQYVPLDEDVSEIPLQYANI